MSQRPKRQTTYGGHPGKIINDTKQKCRTREQIDADNAKEKAAAEAHAQAAVEKRAAAIKRVAAKEDEIQQQEDGNRLMAVRPDRVTMAAHAEELQKSVKEGKWYLEYTHSSMIPNDL